MNQAELYQWQGQIRHEFKDLGYWQALNLGLYSYGMVLAKHCAPSRVREKLQGIAKMESIQRRLERWLANARIDWQSCCRAWAGWVLRCWQGEKLFLLVDETKLGQHMNVMVVGLAYRGGCIPLAFWCYAPDAWPDSQVGLISQLLSWIAPSIPAGCVPIVQADRGLATSPRLIQAVTALGWQYLFRVQNNTHCRDVNDTDQPLSKLLLVPSQEVHMSGQVFKKVGWLSMDIHVLWGRVYKEPWCLVSNCPELNGWEYATRYWQEASFRDLKSDGWQWQQSHIFTPAHANLLVLAMSLAYAWTLTLGVLAFDDPTLYQLVGKGQRCQYSLFRLGLRFTKPSSPPARILPVHFLISRRVPCHALKPAPRPKVSVREAMRERGGGEGFHNTL